MKSWLSGVSLLALVACGGNVFVDEGSGSTSTSTKGHTSTGTQGTGGAGGTSVSTGFATTSTAPDVVSSTGDVNPVGTGGFTSSSTGQGAFGGSPPDSVSVTTVTTATGPQTCDCNTVCNEAEMCGFPASQCNQVCNFLPESAKQCVCDAFPDCNLMQQCVMIGGSGPGQGPTASAISAVSTGTGMGGGTPGGGLTPQCRQCSNQQLMGNACSMQALTCQNNPDCTQLLNCESNCGWTDSCVQGCEAQVPGGKADLAATLGCAVCQNCGMQCASSTIFQTQCQ